MTEIDVELTKLALEDAEDHVRTVAVQLVATLGELCPPELVAAVERLKRAQTARFHALDRATTQAICRFLVLRGTPPEAA